MPLRTRLLVQVLPAVAIAIAAVTAVAVAVASEHQKTAVYAQMQQLIERQAQTFETQASAAMTTAHDLAGSLEGDPRHDRVAGASVVTRLAERHDELFGVWLAFAPNAFDGRDREFRGGVEPHSDKLGQFTTWANRPDGKLTTRAFDDGGSWEHDEYFKVPFSTNRDYVVQPYLEDDVMMTSYTTPIRRNGKAIGVAGVDVALSSLESQTKRMKILDSGYAFVAAPSGQLVSFPAKKGWAGRKTVAQAGLKGHEIVDPIHHRDAIVFSAPVHTGGWTFSAVVPKDEVLAPVRSLRNTLILVGLAALALIGLALVFVARRIAKPVREMAEAAELVATGDLSVEVVADGNDEVGRMGRAFIAMTASLRGQAEVASAIAQGDLSRDVEPRSARDTLGLALHEMALRLREMVGEVSGTAGTLSSASGQLAATSSETGRAVDEIASAVGDVAGGAERQVKVVEAVRRSGEEVAAAARTGASHADDTVRAAAHARSVVDAGTSAAAGATAAMDAVRGAVEDANGAIRALGDRSERIGGIADTITGIAAQTNLLALNAAIEAARAGEQGRGFAVVAEQVRKLAEESQTAAATVSELIAEIQDDTGRAVALVEEGARRSDEGVATVRDAASAFSAIRDGIGEVDAQIERIAEVIAQVERSASAMGADLIEVASVAESSSASTEQVSASAQQTSASAQQIAASAQELADQAGRLNELVGRFTLA
jgi:methyl-accepting chemotaxis protein